MNKADQYLKETLNKIKTKGLWDVEPRPKWSDGTPAHSKFITQQSFVYNIFRGEFPINTLRTTALKGAFHDIESIYIKQTNIIEEMNPLIHSWWQDFVVSQKTVYGITPTGNTPFTTSSIGQTYGHTVKRYDLMNKLLNSLENNPFGRRHIIDLWQEEQMKEDPKALVPCAYSTLWSVSEDEVLMDYNYSGKSNGSPIYQKIRFLDVTLIQRSQDFIMTVSINPAQYVMFAMMVVGHLTKTTGIQHFVGKFKHDVQNCHIYDRHVFAIDELLERKSLGQPRIVLKESKNFYDYTIDDFEFILPEGIQPLSQKLEIAV